MPEGRLQLRRALDEKDEAGLETVALRYSGTEEAAEAHLWLGDRHLVDGEPALAVGRYRQALRTTAGALAARIESRLHLTAALLGQPTSAPPAADLGFGETRLSPAALQALPQTTQRRRRRFALDRRLPPQPAPAPTAFDVVLRAASRGNRRSAGSMPVLCRSP